MQPENKNGLVMETNREESFNHNPSDHIYNKKFKKLPVNGNG